MEFTWAEPKVFWLLPLLLPLPLLLRRFRAMRRDLTVPSLLPFRIMLQHGTPKPPRRRLFDIELLLETAFLTATVLGWAGPKLTSTTIASKRLLLMLDDSTASFISPAAPDGANAGSGNVMRRRADELRETAEREFIEPFIKKFPHGEVQCVGLASGRTSAKPGDILPPGASRPPDGLRGGMEINSTYAAGTAAFGGHPPDFVGVLTSRRPKELGTRDPGGLPPGEWAWKQVGESTDNTALISAAIRAWTQGVTRKAEPLIEINVAYFGTNLSSAEKAIRIKPPGYRLPLEWKNSGRVETFLVPLEKLGLGKGALPEMTCSLEYAANNGSDKPRPDADDIFILKPLPLRDGRTYPRFPFTVTVGEGVGEVEKAAVESLGISWRAAGSDRDKSGGSAGGGWVWLGRQRPESAFLVEIIIAPEKDVPGVCRVTGKSGGGRLEPATFSGPVADILRKSGGVNVFEAARLEPSGGVTVVAGLESGTERSSGKAFSDATIPAVLRYSLHRVDSGADTAGFLFGFRFGDSNFKDERAGAMLAVFREICASITYPCESDPPAAASHISNRLAALHDTRITRAAEAGTASDLPERLSFRAADVNGKNALQGNVTYSGRSLLLVTALGILFFLLGSRGGKAGYY